MKHKKILKRVKIYNFKHYMTMGTNIYGGKVKNSDVSVKTKSE